MKKLLCIVGLMVFLFNCFQSKAQNISNKGKEFWVGYGHHQYMTFPTDNSQNMTIYLSAEEAATVTIEIDSSGLLPSQWWRRTYNIPANTVIDIANSATPAASFTTAALSWGPIPKGTVDAAASNTSVNYDARLVNDPPPAGNGGEGLFRRKGIHITSNVPIVAYAHIYGGVSSGATMLLPVESWGYAYTSINSNQSDAQNSYNWVYVIARFNNTVIEITPSQVSQLGKPAGVPFQVTLNKGQIYQLQGQANPAGNGVNLTGTNIKVIANGSGVCNPIAVFSGSSRTLNVCSGGGGGRDNDMQQGFPQQTWGKRYLLAPLSEATSSTNLQPSKFQTNPYRVVVRDPTTVVRRNGVVMTGLLANSFYYFESAQGELIEADKPIMVAQYMSGGCLDGLGDPEMIYISPIEQGVKKTGFYRNTKEAINVNYVTIVVPTTGVGSLRIDNSATFNHQYVHPRDPKYTVVIKGWAASQAQSLVTCDSAFTAVTYGLGGAESYGYNAGTYLNNLNAVSDFYNAPDTSRNTVKNHPFGFTNTPMEIGALIRYKPLKIWWKLSNVGSVLSPNADVIQNNPVPLDSVQITGGWSYRYRLSGNYTFNTAGTYYVPMQLTSDVYGTNDCRNIEDLSVEYIIKPIPTADFTHMVGACSSDSVRFFGPTTTAEGYKVLKWKWTFSSAAGDTSVLQNPKAKLVTGGNNVKLELVVEIGGLATVTKTVNVPGAVDVKWGASSYNICVGQTVNFTDTTTTAGITNYHWNFGDGGAGSVVNTNSNATLSYQFNTVGSFTVKHTVTVPTATCPIDTIPRIINVAAKAYVDFNVSPNCQPANGLTTFSANLPPGVTATGYTWTFGDPSSGALNTGTGATATHNYNADGTYAVKLAITTPSGCNGDSTKNIVINRKPEITGIIGVVSVLCDNTPPITITPPTIGNGVTGTALMRSFKGGIIDPSNTNYNPAIAGFGVDTIYYKFTTVNSCVDSTKYPITVAARPRGNFTYLPANTTCIPSTTAIAFTSNITVPNSSVQSYSWFLESPSTAPATRSNLANPSYNYAEGTYLVQLSLTGVNGCMFDTVQNITISKAPAIAPLAVSDLCDNTAPFSITAPIVSGGVTGTGSFRSFKNAITTAGLYTPATAGFGVDTIYYRFTTNNNCSDSVKVAINVKARPRGNFSFSPSGCLDATGNVNFTSNITIPGSTIQTYAWQFESPSTTAPNISSLPNPSHVYNAGSYTVKLSLTGANGCSFDTSQNVTFGRKPAISALAQPNICESVAPFNLTAPSITNSVTGVGSWSSFKNAASTAGLYNPATAGFGVDTIFYKFTTGVDCYDSVKQAITVLARPRASFTFSPSGCLDASGTVNFTSSANVPNSTVSSYLWKFEDPSVAPGKTSTAANPSQVYTDGTYTIRLTVNAANTCSFDTLQTVTFSRKPSINPIVQANVCDNAAPFGLNAPNITNGVVGTGTWRSFKNASNASGLYTPATAGFGIDTLYYKFTATGGICVDSVKLPITVLARPRGNFSFTPTGCLPSNGAINFTSNIIVPNSSVSNYFWQFQDPIATPPTTSTLANPSYNYTTDGVFTIRLNLTGANSCSFDTAQTVTFSRKPSIAPLVQANVCDNNAAFNLSAPSITNGVTGTGTWSSFKNASNASGLYAPSIAGFGVDTIYYKFTSNGGCSDSVKLPITILARPRASFTFSPNGCLDATGTVNFTSSANVPNSSVSGYLWKFEDPSVAPGKTSTLANPSQVYNDGTFTIRLTVNGTNGCSFDTLQTQTFSKKPLIAPIVVSSVCENDAAFTVSTPAITNGALGTGTFRSFKGAITAAGLYTPLTAGYGVDTIYYRFITGGGCTDSVKTPITIKARPRATFTFSPNGCLDATGTVNFTSSANVPNSSVSGYLWKFEDPSVAPGKTSTLANPSQVYNDGTYTIRLTVNGTNGCSFDTLQTQTFSKKPLIAPIVVSSVCENDAAFTVSTPAITNGALGTGTFRSFKGAITTAGLYTPLTAGYGIDTIYYRFITGGGCTDSVKTPITIKARPRASFSFSPTGCLGIGGVVNFTSSANVPNSSVSGYLWKFDDVNNPSLTSILPNPTNSYLDGTYTIRLTVTGANGCSFDTLRIETFNRFPDVRPITVSSTCENGPSFNVTPPSVINNVNGTGVFSSFKNAISAAGNYNPATAGAGVDTIYYTFTSNGGCATTVKTMITINARPRASFSFSPTGCLGIGGVVNFTSSANVPNSSVSGYLWKFDDVNNPSLTSMLPNPTNSYLDGTYTIRLTVTGANGCSFDTLRTETFNRFPDVRPITVGSTCENGPSFNVTPPSVTNNVNGTGVFSSFKNAISAAGNYNPATAGAGVDTIYYTFTSNGGCATTVKTMITIHPKPNASFTVQADVCLDSLARFVYTGSNPTISITNWQWFYGNGNTDNFTNGNPFTKTYNNVGPYVVKLVTVSNNGCLSDTGVQNITIRPMPVAAFTVPAVVCMPNGVTTFTNASSITPVGTLNYTWIFGDAANATLANPDTSNAINGSHVYGSIANYTVSLKVESAYGCVKNEVKSINPFKLKPNAFIKVNKDTLCQGNISNFIDSSWSVGSNVQSWRWFFGDGGQSPAQNPNYTYAQPGNYTVKLVTTNAAGCVSDTFPKNVLVYLQPVIDAGPSFVVQQGTILQFVPTANDSLTTRFLWTPAADFAKPDTLRPILNTGAVFPSSNATSITKIYRLTAIGLGQCTATDTLTVKILGQLKIPNAFSPNNDGINDVWDIPNLVDYPGASVQIFNRNGQPVFFSNGYNKAWDGKYLGNPLPTGTYYYIINPRNGYNVISGSVTILR